MAALYIAKDQQRYRFETTSQPRYAYDVVTVEDATDLQMIAELCDCALEDILDLNPHVRRWCTPPNERYDVRVPLGKGSTCAERIAQVPPEERITWRRHRVKRGDTVGSLAKTYSTSVQAIAAANRLPAKKSLRPGAYLIVPVIPNEPSPRVAQYIEQAAKSASLAGSDTQSKVYVVRRGDTLSSISRRHRVSVAQIMKWNSKRSAHIRVGERLRIQAPAAVN
jgi:membrane-bound lytic murein transglycosylase D